MNQFLYCNRNYLLRKILNKQENADIIKDLIESILDIKIKRITVNHYLKKNEKYLPEEKNFGMADVRIKTDSNEDYNIGIQFLDGKHLPMKIALYYLYIHTNQICYEDKRKAAKTITINFLDFPYQNDNSNYHEVVMLNDFKTIKFKEEEAETHIIELPKFTIENPNKISKAEQWIGYLKGESQEILDTIISKNKYIEKLDNMVQDYWDNETI